MHARLQFPSRCARCADRALCRWAGRVVLRKEFVVLTVADVVSASAKRKTGDE